MEPFFSPYNLYVKVAAKHWVLRNGKNGKPQFQAPVDVTRRKVCEILIFSTYGQKYFQHMAAQKLPDTKMNLGGKIHIKVKRFFQETFKLRLLIKQFTWTFVTIYISWWKVFCQKKKLSNTIYSYLQVCRLGSTPPWNFSKDKRSSLSTILSRANI